MQGDLGAEYFAPMILSIFSEIEYTVLDMLFTQVKYTAANIRNSKLIIWFVLVSRDREKRYIYETGKV